jgi:hypothetical protein
MAHFYFVYRFPSIHAETQEEARDKLREWMYVNYKWYVDPEIDIQTLGPCLPKKSGCTADLE